MKQEANMGKRRPITRADEDEVRRRVAQAGLDYPVTVDDADGDHVRIAGFWGDDPDRVAREALATVGIFPGPDGWEIEDAPAVAARRKLPAPWAWWSCDAPRFAHLSQTGKLDDCVAQAWPNEAIIYHTGKRKGIDSRFDVSSLEDAKARAEDECWSRGLFGVSDAPPVAPTPVDREQAIRDALLTRLGGGDASDTELINLLNGSAGRPFATTAEIKAALASIGAVGEAYTWRLSDGPPPGWEWRGGGWLVRTGDDGIGKAIALAGDGRDGRGRWFVYPDGGPVSTPDETTIDAASARDAALLACRKAGLFAPIEPTIAAPVEGDDDAPESEPEGFNDAEELLCQLLANEQGCAGDSERERIASAFIDRLKVEIRGETEGVIAGTSQAQGMGAQARTIEGLVFGSTLPLSEPSADPAARMLLRMFSAATGIGIDGMREGHPDTTPTQRIQQVARLCDSFVAEMRAGRRTDCQSVEGERNARRFLGEQLAAAEKERDELRAQLAVRQERAAYVTGISALVDYLKDNHADSWKADESAQACAVRLLRSADDTIETLRREAEGADAARAIVATERDTYREEARRLREQVGALDRACSAAAFNVDRVAKERDAARAERDRFEKLHAAAEATAGEIEGELGIAEGKLARALDDAAAMVAHAGRLEQFLSGAVAT